MAWLAAGGGPACVFEALNVQLHDPGEAMNPHVQRGGCLLLALLAAVVHMLVTRQHLWQQRVAVLGMNSEAFEQLMVARQHLR